MASQHHRTISNESNVSSSTGGSSGYVHRYGELTNKEGDLQTNVQVHHDGRINLSLACHTELPELPLDHAPSVNEFAVDSNWKDCPPLSIVIMIVGSRGDVQPYVALGKRLKRDGHRVRIATHETFRDFVISQHLDFFDIGGNPADLMSYMVKNPGLIPGMQSLANGDIRKNKAMMKEMIYGCWESCYSPSKETGMSFVADAIISNPPGFAHIHCAQALGIPLQMSFTMPWSPTSDFPHPLVNITKTNAKPGLTNYLTYSMADLLTWQGMGTIINKFRERVVNLEPLDVRSGPSILEDLKVPWTYCMSPALVPKPDDWKNNIDVVGFYFLDLATDFQPSADLVAFLSAGEPPIYIGFGSVVVDDPKAMTKLIFEATAQAGVRALVSAGWGGLGGIDIPPHIFILGNIPHDWLFDKERVAAIVHHGGAGTTAIGLLKGRPTVVVPFFGDQGFWGSMIRQAGAGPKPIPHRKLTVDGLRDAIKFAISPEAKDAAKKLARQIQNDNGVEKGVQSLYRHLPLLNMRCDLVPSLLAVWWSTHHCLKLSAFAAQTLANEGLIDLNELELHRTRDYDAPHEFSLSEEVGSVLEYVTSIAESLLSPVKEAIETSAAVPLGIMRMVTSTVDSSEEKKGKHEKEPQSPNQKERSERKGFLHGLFHREGSSPSKKEEEHRKREYIKQKARKIYKSGIRAIESGIDRVQQQRHKARLKEGVDAFNTSSIVERAQVIQAFQTAKGGVVARRNTYVEAAKQVLVRRVQRRMDSLLIEPLHEEPIPLAGSTSETTVMTDSPIRDDVDWDARFEKDLASALRNSLDDTQEKYP